MDLISEIRNLNLENIDPLWVQDVLNMGFTIVKPLPDDYLQNLSPTLINTLKNIIEELEFVKDLSTSSISWTDIKNHIQRDELLSLLFYFVNGRNNVMNNYTKTAKCAILAARVYLRLLLVPGSGVFYVFYEHLYLECINCLKYIKRLSDNYSNKRDTHLHGQLAVIFSYLQAFIEDLCLIICDQAFDLRSRDIDCVDDTLTALIDLLVSTQEVFLKSHFDGQERNRMVEATHKSIKALIDLGDEEWQITILEKIFFTEFLSKILQFSLKVTDKHLCEYVSEYAIRVFKENIAFGLEPYKILIQHICYVKDGLERLDVRMIRTNIIITLMWVLEREEYMSMVNWLIKLSCTQYGAHRNMSLCVLGKLFKRIEDAFQRVSLAHQPTPPHRRGSRREDYFPGNELIGEMPHDDSSSDEEQAQVLQGANPEHPNVIREDSHSIDMNDLMTCALRRCTDCNGPVRLTALLLITQFVKFKNPAIESMIKGKENYACLVDLASEAIIDEVVGVRRTAILLLNALFEKDPTLISRSNIKLLTIACNDSSQTVRLAALHQIAELMQTTPNVITINAFLEGPMQMQSDPVDAVQNAVYDHIHNKIITSFTHYDQMTNNGTSVLPWAFLTEIIKRSMKQNLSIVLQHLHEKNRLPSKLVKILLSHLKKDSDNDLCCWLMLSCLASLTIIPDVTFAIDYYYGLLKPIPEGSFCAKNLVLDVITSCCSTITGNVRVNLHSNLINDLRLKAMEGVGIFDSQGIINRAIAVLAAQLDPTNIEWASNILSICEEKVEAGAPLEQWLVAGDISLIAPRPPSEALFNALIRIVSSLERFHDPDEPWNMIQKESWRLACATTALGRVSLRVRERAYKASAALERLATSNACVPAAARINALLTLADLSTSCTSVVNSFLNSVFACLQNNSALEDNEEGYVRETKVLRLDKDTICGVAARILTRMLQRGFLKLGNNLYFKYFALLAEDDPEITGPIKYYIRVSVHADVIERHFLEAVLLYNGSKISDIDPSRSSDEFTSDDFKELQGEHKRETRLGVYEVMLTQMSYKKRLNVQLLLINNFFERVASSTTNLPPNEQLNAAISDVFMLLRNPLMEPSRNQNEEMSDLAEFPAIASRSANQKLKSDIMDKIIPTLIKLYKHLKYVCSPLSRMVIDYIKEVSIDYNEEIDYLLTADDDLVADLSQLNQLKQCWVVLEPLIM